MIVNETVEEEQRCMQKEIHDVQVKKVNW
ncbi:Protein of unknown function [Bacillus mycoides]|nr:Protein of unknown function [Bacillus mycoides]